MPRKALKPRERRGLPDPHFKYGSVLVSRFINRISFEGKKSMSERIIEDAFQLIREKTKEEPLAVFNRAIENAKPLVEVKPRRVGGAGAPREPIRRAMAGPAPLQRRDGIRESRLPLEIPKRRRSH